MDEPITDGVKITFGAVDENVDRRQISFVISDGTSAGGWSDLTADMLDDGLGDTQVMQTVTIGSLVVSFTIVDLSGNGKVNQGDFIRLTATSFAADTDYTFAAIYEPTDGAMGQCTFSG
ncbi:MAG: Type pilin [Candidatus Thermoplasmatota archaeon]|nr:Type pilin [Candidatus Thermoplasmatota archaeon]